MAKNATLERIFRRLGNSNDSDIPTATIAGFKLVFVPIGTLSDKKASPEQKRYAVARDITTEVIAIASYLGITKAVKELSVSPLSKAFYKKRGVLDANKELGLDAFELDQKLLKEYVVKSDKLSNPTAENKRALKDLESSAAGKHYKALSERVAKINAHENFPEFKKGFVGFCKGVFSSKQKMLDPKDLYMGIKSSISHVTICTLAILVIPSVCNVALGLVLKKNNKKNDAKPQVQPLKKLDPYPSQNTLNRPNVKKPSSVAFNGRMNALRVNSGIKVGG